MLHFQFTDHEPRAYPKEALPEKKVDAAKAKDFKAVAKKFVPSAFQQAIYDWIKNDTGHLVINAVAGSGKTTTIVNGISEIPGRSNLKICFLALNRHIADELRSRLPKSVTVSTMHSLGMACIRKYFMGELPGIDTSGITVRDGIYAFGLKEGWFGRLADGEDFTKEEIREHKKYCETLSDLLSKCKSTMSLTNKQIEQAAERFGFTELEKNDFARIEKFILHTYIRPELSFSKLCFDDMVFLPAMGKVEKDIHKYDYVFIDEVQDLNAAQQTFLYKLLKEDGRLISVGDPKQAIYGFSGADHNSFHKLTQRENTKKLPLSDCYRCGKEIIALAQTVVPYINAHQNNIEGIVRYGSMNEVEAHDLVLCRFNAPMISLCFEYIRQGKRAQIKGKDIGASLIAFVRKYRYVTETPQLIKNIHAESQQLLKEIMVTASLDREEAMSNPRFVSFSEKYLTLKVIAGQCKTDQVRELIEKINALFEDDDKGGIVLSSIHKAKGLEADRVFILGDDFAPAFQAKKQWEVEQEMNLIYVAYTRAKKELIFINDYEELLTKNEKVKTHSSRYEDFIKFK